MKEYIPYTDSKLYTDGRYIYQVNRGIIDAENFDMSEYWGENDKIINFRTLIISAIQKVKLPKNLISKIIPYYDKNDEFNFFKYYYKFPEEGIEHEEMKGHYYIPYHTSYLATKDCKIYSLSTKKYYKPFKVFKEDSDNKYVYTRALKDYQASFSNLEIYDQDILSSCVIHRLIAFTFCKYESNPFKCVVNHIDGNKRNYAISNLEWVTYSDNLKHAFVTDLRKDNMPVRVKDYFTGNVTEYYSISDAGRNLSVDDESVRYKLVNTNGDSMLKGRYVVKYKNDHNSWPSVYDLFGKKTFHYIEAYNIYTDEIVVGLGINEIANLLNWNMDKTPMIVYMLHSQLKTLEFCKPYNGYLFKYKLDDRLRFRKFYEFEKTLFKKLDKIKHVTGVQGCICIKNGKFAGVYIGKTDIIDLVPGMSRDIFYSRMNSGKVYKTGSDEYYFYPLYKNKSGISISNNILALPLFRNK